MKKLLILFSIAAFAACGNPTTSTNNNNDSTSTTVKDSVRNNADSINTNSTTGNVELAD